MRRRFPLLVIATALAGSAMLSPSGGAQAVSAEFTDPQAVYRGAEVELGELPSGGVVNRAVLEQLSRTQPTEPYTVEILARTLEQFSVLLPESDPDAKAPTPIGRTRGFVPVNTPVNHGQELTIDGVRMVFYTDFDSDTDDQTIVYLPDRETVLNNHLWPSFPNFYTLRGSVYRDPREWAGGIRLIRDLEPEHLVNTHCIPVSGKEKVREVLGGYYDAIMYLYDQTLRGILHGKTAEGCATKSSSRRTSPCCPTTR